MRFDRPVARARASWLGTKFIPRTAARMRFFVASEMRGLSRSASDTVIADRPSCLPISLSVISRFTVYASTRDTLSQRRPRRIRAPPRVSCYPLAGPPRSAAACPRTACPTATASSSATSRRPPPQVTGSRSSSRRRGRPRATRRPTSRPRSRPPRCRSTAEAAARLPSTTARGPCRTTSCCRRSCAGSSAPASGPTTSCSSSPPGRTPPTPPAQFGDTVPAGILERYRVVSHDAHDAQGLAPLGETSRGTPVWINREYLARELRVVVGVIEPHQFVGFSGGVKSAAIGLAGYDDHRAQPLDDVAPARAARPLRRQPLPAGHRGDRRAGSGCTSR